MNVEWKLNWTVILQMEQGVWEPSSGEGDRSCEFSLKRYSVQKGKGVPQESIEMKEMSVGKVEEFEVWW